jgi:Glycosyl transferase family 2.
MKSSMNYISVIITAYDRKEYLLQAINSTIKQSLSKDLYEIILIKISGMMILTLLQIRII